MFTLISTPVKELKDDDEDETNTTLYIKYTSI